MGHEENFCYSPFNASSTFDLRQQSLLLQFTLMALVQEAVEKRVASVALHEYIRLFPYAFMNMQEPITALIRCIKKAEPQQLLPSRTRQECFRKLKPFFHVCKTDETLWLFLLKQGQHLDSKKNLLSLLQELYEEDLLTASERMHTRFLARGFSYTAKECMTLLHHLQAAL